MSIAKKPLLLKLHVFLQKRVSKWQSSSPQPSAFVSQPSPAKCPDLSAAQ